MKKIQRQNDDEWKKKKESENILKTGEREKGSGKKEIKETRTYCP